MSSLGPDPLSQQCRAIRLPNTAERGLCASRRGGKQRQMIRIVGISLMSANGSHASSYR